MGLGVGPDPQYYYLIIITLVYFILYKLYLFFFTIKKKCILKLILANIKVIKQLGKGGFGSVYKVMNENKFYAIKEVNLENESKESIAQVKKKLKFYLNLIMNI